MKLSREQKDELLEIIAGAGFSFRNPEVALLPICSADDIEKRKRAALILFNAISCFGRRSWSCCLS